MNIDENAFYTTMELFLQNLTKPDTQKIAEASHHIKLCLLHATDLTLITFSKIMINHAGDIICNQAILAVAVFFSTNNFPYECAPETLQLLRRTILSLLRLPQISLTMHNYLIEHFCMLCVSALGNGEDCSEILQSIDSLLETPFKRDAFHFFAEFHSHTNFQIDYNKFFSFINIEQDDNDTFYSEVEFYASILVHNPQEIPKFPTFLARIATFEPFLQYKMITFFVRPEIISQTVFLPIIQTFYPILLQLYTASTDKLPVLNALFQLESPGLAQQFADPLRMVLNHSVSDPAGEPELYEMGLTFCGILQSYHFEIPPQNPYMTAILVYISKNPNDPDYIPVAIDITKSSDEHIRRIGVKMLKILLRRKEIGPFIFEAIQSYPTDYRLQKLLFQWSNYQTADTLNPLMEGYNAFLQNSNSFFLFQACSIAAKITKNSAFIIQILQRCGSIIFQDESPDQLLSIVDCFEVTPPDVLSSFISNLAPIVAQNLDLFTSYSFLRMVDVSPQSATVYAPQIVEYLTGILSQPVVSIYGSTDGIIQNMSLVDQLANNVANAILSLIIYQRIPDFPDMSPLVLPWAQATYSGEAIWKAVLQYYTKTKHQNLYSFIQYILTERNSFTDQMAAEILVLFEFIFQNSPDETMKLFPLFVQKLNSRFYDNYKDLIPIINNLNGSMNGQLLELIKDVPVDSSMSGFALCIRLVASTEWDASMIPTLIDFFLNDMSPGPSIFRLMIIDRLASLMIENECDPNSVDEVLKYCDRGDSCAPAAKLITRYFNNGINTYDHLMRFTTIDLDETCETITPHQSGDLLLDLIRLIILAAANPVFQTIISQLANNTMQLIKKNKFPPELFQMALDIITPYNGVELFDQLKDYFVAQIQQQK